MKQNAWILGFPRENSNRPIAPCHLIISFAWLLLFLKHVKQWQRFSRVATGMIQKNSEQATRPHKLGATYGSSSSECA